MIMKTSVVQKKLVGEHRYFCSHHEALFEREGGRSRGRREGWRISC